MIGLPNPWMIIGALVALAGLYGWGHHKGWAERDAEMQLEVSRKNAAARETEQKLTEQINDQTYKLKEANDAITQKQTDLDRAIRAGRLRLNTSSCVQASTSTTTPSGDRNDAASESDRETLAAIAAIVAQGDRNTEQLNACIAAYNQVREQINGQR